MTFVTTFASITSPNANGFRGLSAVQVLGGFEFRWVVQAGYVDGTTYTVGRDADGVTWWNAINGAIIGDTIAWDGNADEFLLWCLLEGDEVEAEEEERNEGEVYHYLTRVQSASEKALCQR